MRITMELDYAIRIMNCLAEREISSRNGINAAAISEAISVPLRFTLKILGKLTSAGLVKSYKGAGGGYALVMSPSDITLLDIVETIDGPVTISRCLEHSCECTRPDIDKKSCFYYHIFDDINAIITQKLKSVTLDMAQGQNKN